MSGRATPGPTAPEVYISGTKIPYVAQWLYRVTVDGVLKDEINSSEQWTPQQFIDVQSYYRESLTGYVFGGEPLEGWTPPTSPTPRQPVFQSRRRKVRPVND